MPSGSVSKVDDRKLGIPQYTEFNDKYGFKNPNFKTTRATGLIGGVATEEEAEFVKYFGVPYIYGPSLVSQKAMCRPANFAKMKQFLEYRLTTLDAQIKSPLAMSTGNSLPTVKFKKIKDKLSNFLTEMGSSKTLPTCDDYKIDYFQDDSDLMNYLTRALYYGLKPDAGTDEHVKCVNLFRDAAGTDAELKALLEIVKDKRKDGMLSFMELVGSTLAGLIQKINQDRSFATATIGTATATATAATAATTGAEAAEAKSYLDTVRKLHDQLIVFFDEISKSDSGEIGKKTFIKGQPIAEILTQFTAAVAASKRYLTSSGAGKPGTPAFPTKVEDLKKLIMDGLVGVGGTVGSAMKADSVYDKNMSKVLTDLLAFLEKGPITSAAVGAAIDKITLITAFKDVDIMEILKSYLLYTSNLRVPIRDSDKSIIKSYQKLFAVLNALGLFDELKDSKSEKGKNIEANMKINLNENVKYTDRNTYEIPEYHCYVNGNFTYGYFKLVNIADSSDTIVFFDEKLVSAEPASAEPPKTVEGELKKYNGFSIGSTIEITTGTPEIIREKHISYAPPTLVGAGKPKPSEKIYLTVKNTSKVEYNFSEAFLDPRRVEAYKITVPAGTDPLTNGEEKFDLGAPVASTGAGAGAGAGTANPAEVVRLTAALAAAQADLTRLQAELATKGGEATTAAAAEAAKCADLQRQIDTLTANGEASATTIAGLRAELAAAQKVATEAEARAAAAAAAGAAGVDTAEIQRRIAEKEARIVELEAAITAATERATQAEARATEADAGRATAQADLATARDERASIQTQLTTARAEIERLSSAGGGSELATLQETVAKLTRQLEEANAATAAAEARATEASKALGSAETLIAEKEAEVERLTQQIAAINGQLASNNAATAAEIAALTAEVGTLTTARDEAVSELAKKGTSTTEIRSSLEGRLKTTNDENTRLKSELAGVRSELETAIAKAASEEAAKKVATTRIPEIEAQLKALQTSSSADKTRLEQELAAAKSAAAKPSTISPEQIARLEAQAESLEQRIASARSTIESLNGSIRSLVQQKIKLEQEFGQIRGIAFTKQTLERLATDLKAAQDSAALSEGEIKRRDAIQGVQQATATLGNIISDGLKADADKLKGVLTTVQQQLDRVRQNIEWQEGKIRQFAADKNQLLGALAQLESKKKLLEEEVERLKTADSTGAVDNPTIAAMLDTIRTAIKLKGSSPEAAAALEALQVQLAEQELEIAEKAEQLEIAQADLVAARKTSTDAEARAIAAEMGDMLYEDAKRREEAALAEVERLKAELADTISDYELTLKKAEQQIAQIPQEIEGPLYAQIRGLESKISELQRDQGVAIDEPNMTTDALFRKASALSKYAKRQKSKRGEQVVGELSWGSQQKYEKALAGKDSEIAALTAAVSEATKNAEAAAKEALDELRAENQALQTENSALKEQLAALQTQLASMRNVSKVQTFGSLSGMLSSPAFKAATIGIFTKFADKKERKTYTNLNVNTNIRSSLPGQPEGTETSAPLRAYYIQTLEALAKELGAIKKDGSEDPDITFVENQQEIQLLANILKIMSSPQPSGLYALIDDSLLLSNIKTLTDKLKTQREGFSSYEPSLFVPEKPMTGIKIDTTKAVSNTSDNLILGNYFNDKLKYIFVTYPSMKISGEQSEGVADLDRNSYISKVSLSLFNIGEFAVKQDKFINGKMLSDLKVEDKSFFTEPTNGKLISRSEIVRIFIKSLLSALKSAWGPMVNK